MPADEAIQLLHDFHRVGVLLHFDDHPTLRNYVFLHPDSIIDSVFENFGLQGPTQSLLEKLVRTCVEPVLL